MMKTKFTKIEYTISFVRTVYYSFTGNGGGKSLEVWRTIQGYEGLYEVSNLGRVRSLDHYDSLGRLHMGVILKPQLDGRKNYLHVSLGRHSMKQVHRLVAEAFLDNPDGLPQVNHKDENKTNNTVENLEWCSAKYNNNYGSKVGSKRGERHHGAKVTEEMVYEIKRRIVHGEKQKDLAIEYGLSTSQLSAINVGRYWGWVKCT